METDNDQPAVSKTRRWAGYILSGLPVLLLLFSASGKFLKPDGMEESIGHLGWKMDQMMGLGILEGVCVILYLIPQTAVLGAILLTAYLGGATATHVRIDDSFVIPVILGVMLWLGLYLRDPRLHDLAPIRKLK